MIDANPDILRASLAQALERRRNDAMNREAQLPAAVMVFQQQIQALTKERDGLRAENEKLKAAESSAGPPFNADGGGDSASKTDGGSAGLQ
jgi:hypothetical protein